MQRINTATKAVDKFGSGKHGFNDGNKAGGVAATVVDAAWADSLQEEISNVIEGAGIALDPNDREQMAKAIQSGKLLSATAGGTADAITSAFTPAIAILTHGMTLRVRSASANATTTPTFTPNSGTIAAKTIVKGNGLALAVGDIAGAAHWLDLQYDSTLDKWVLLNPAHGVKSLGVGQTWQNVAASRAFSTTYTNTTGRPIQVSVWGISSAASNIALTVDGVTSGSVGQGVPGTTVLANAIVPNGSTYSASFSSGTPTLQGWAELR